MMRTTQISWAAIIIILTLISLCGLILNSAYSYGILLLGVIALLLTCQITLRIDGNWIRFTMGIGLIRGKYAIGNIENCRVVRCFPIGCGVRFGNGPALYNVANCRAVELRWRGNKRTVRLGTNEPYAFVRCFYELKRKKRRSVVII